MHIQELVRQIKAGTLSSTQLCEESIRRITEHDQNGRKLNAVSLISPFWREEARALDEAEERAVSDKPLYGIPVLVKDNIEVKGLPNPAGSYVLRDLIAEEDSAVIRRLRNAGAVILGKCCLSEFAYWMSEDGMPSGYSSLNGQVVHPYNPSFDPSGSSSGSAVAAAARYCPITVGTETDGSLMSPAISNGIVSIKPTLGLVPQDGILPLSHVQDTAGPMANSVEDCALLLEAMSADDTDVAEFRSALSSDLRGKRIGVFTVKDYVHDMEYLGRLKQIISDHGGEAVEFELEKAEIDEYECLVTEFKYDINRYLSQRNCMARSLHDIIRMNEEDAQRCLKHGQSLLIKSENSSGSMDDPEYRKLRTAVNAEASSILNSAIEGQSLSCMVTVCSSAPTNLAAITGACSMVIPAREVNETAYDPLSFYMLSAHRREEELIRLAFTLEQALGITCRPSWLPADEA